MDPKTATLLWPAVDPAHGNVRLRRFRDEDAGMARELSLDDYVPTIGTLPPRATADQALAWVERQRRHHVRGTGFAFCIADAESDRPLGQIGLWTRELAAGRAHAGYGVAPFARGRRVAASALLALLDFGWTIPGLHRVELFIEPWNTASTRSAEYAGFSREGLLRSHQEIAGERRDMLLYAAIRDAGRPAIDSPAATPGQ
ncbi:GNAT family protein [Arthrobacter sp. zg-Y820]|uniref:GNAT family N-acetyltransferase n=1 Tax=unclassified Arthrobacter TaxID=235627 RepID=UPI001E34444D|nr:MULTISPECIES: GNAT family protein [unclassified Arthrobacter]MCC9197587.1 GNAT family N-acetyltransferase [Arthrobacter sp. zg-Y820]MDK1280454.1 GNAT family protein [Arthrobacter sp. zg.Y820]WIB10902.1 GNAT family protein [Arthrobacter sp. zg-Y820]